MAKDVTEILIKVSEEASDEAYNKPFSIVYDELKDIANQQINRERDRYTFSKTDLVHEAIIDCTRKKLAVKRGGNFSRQSYIDDLITAISEAKTILSLDEALEKLEQFDKRMADVVNYGFLGGLTIEETAEILQVPKNTVNRD